MASKKREIQATPKMNLAKKPRVMKTRPGPNVPLKLDYCDLRDKMFFDMNEAIGALKEVSSMIRDHLILQTAEDNKGAAELLERIEGKKLTELKDKNKVNRIPGAGVNEDFSHNCTRLNSWMEHLENLHQDASDKERWSLVCYSLHKLQSGAGDQHALDLIKTENDIDAKYVESEWKRLSKVRLPTSKDDDNKHVKALDQVLEVLQHLTVGDWARSDLLEAQDDFDCHPFPCYAPEDLVLLARLVCNDLKAGADLGEEDEYMSTL